MKIENDTFFYIFFLSILFLLSLLFAIYIGFPSLDHKNNIQFYADTPTYEMALKQRDKGDNIELITVGSN